MEAWLFHRYFIKASIAAFEIAAIDLKENESSVFLSVLRFTSDR